jgi:hypothetical protein
MCCIITALFIFGPRIAIFVWWVINPFRFASAFSTWIIPVIFAVFAPFTMIAYLIVWPPGTGLYGFDWLWIALGVLLDISSYTGGGIGRRRRFKSC